MTSKANEIVLELIRLISQPPFKRENQEIELVLPWLCKRSQLLQNQTKSVLLDIVKNCTFLSVSNDDVIIKQGERGDSFYVILRGSASIYIDPRMTGEGTGSEDTLSRTSAKKKKKKKNPKMPESEASVLSGMEKPSEGDSEDKTDKATKDEEEEEEEEEEGPTRKKPIKLLAPLERNKYGKYIAGYGVGNTFGEVALVNRDTFRNASIIADEDTDLIVIDQDLFDRSLRAEQEARYAEIRDFIEEHPFFKDMNTKFKKLLEMSIRKERYIFDTNIIRQGDPVTGLHFILSGSANISIQPKKHVSQYPHLWPFEAGVDQIAIEFEHLREMRRAAILRKYEDPSVWETKPEELVIRREQGYAAIEKKMKENHISLCSVQNKEVLGDIEMLVNLDTYMQTVRCTSDTTCFVLDTKNFERLVSKKNNPQTMDYMREYVKSKLDTRMHMRHADLVPLMGYLHQKLTEQSLPPTKKVEPFKTSKSIPDVDEEMQHLLQYFKEGKEVMLIKPCIPGVVYYHELMQEKAKARELQRKAGEAKKAGDAIKISSVYKRKQQRKPRSMLQIRESLKQMMEAEVIEMETKKFRKKKPKSTKGSHRKKEPRISDRSLTKDSPKTLVGLMNDKQTHDNDNKPGLISLMKAVAQKKEDDASISTTQQNGGSSIENSLASNPNLPKSTPPVFVTEMAKQSDLKLPAIREENTQDEIILNKNAVSETNQNGTAIEKSVGHETTRNDSLRKDIPDGKPRNTGDKQSGIDTSISLPPIKQNQHEARSDITASHKEMVPKLPNLGGSQTSLNQGLESQRTEDDSASTVSSRWQTAITFVNQRVQERLTNAIMEEETSYKDFETSEPSLRLLEHKIQAFHIKYGKGDKTKNLPPLKRYKLDQPDEQTVRPKPGGKVWVKKQQCKFSDTEFVVKDHKHVRYQMVESIPEFDRVQKSRVVVQQILKTADYRNKLT
ncbi:uncharacterized protein LOC123531447 isoform X2 [Mercenaria mercenaria]|uniref:uncharacterized protein LOC123531447 isoform X2 n=1 Tax=Mercenaria mercenaria TaxID=6596 RepID=UPI00234F57E4|nr:uncharacterized protein LOC123531447 isoform X2 [Mercenaria mercenaria]